ncbi:DUF6389 family protein [Flavivirga eckloniae]|uniref:Uncharacterized protein n=1 Tax=Flavivirga eckloniae TaxID=1803846 RepID=A0A2K9PVT9_9FLAO|nr:DUF6389 family protein [Flavivirga eckloniae]AUP81182.1 hypothetical protein C1H87_21685 [Flavivirga eckloniae]
MEENKYKIELRKVLDENSSSAIKNLNATLQSLPEKTKSVELMIFPNQDGEGTFGVRVSLSGPDLYVLNKAIEGSADLINIIHTPEGLKPAVPLMNPFDSSFEVNDVLSDVVGDWLKFIWSQVDNNSINLPVTIIADEDYGMTLPIELN